MNEVDVSPEQMTQIIQDAAVDMGRSGKETKTPVLVDTAVMLMRVATQYEIDTHRFPPIVLRAAFDTAVSWMEATAKVADSSLTDELMDMGGK